MAGPWEAYADVSEPSVKERAAAASAASAEATAGRTAALTPADLRLRAAQATALEAKNRKAAEAQSEAQKAARQDAIKFRDNASMALDAIQRLRSILGPTSAGYGAMLKDLPESRAKEAAALIQQLQSNKFFTQIAELKSEGGGKAGIGRVLQSEIPLFLSRWGNLDQARDNRGLGESLNVMENQIRRMYARVNGADIDNADPEAAYRARQQYGIREPGEALAQPIAPSVTATLPELKPLAAGSATKAQVPPTPMQREFEAWVAPRLGHLDPKEYAQFRSELDKKYGFGGEPGYAEKFYGPEAEALNEGAKRGASINLQIPPVDVMASEQERAAAEARHDPITGRLLSAGMGLTGGLTSDLFPTAVAKITGKPEEELRRTQAAYEGEYPGAAMAGRVAGGVGQAALLPEAATTKYAGVPYMAASGAVSGAATHPEDRLAGAVSGGTGSALLGAAFGGAGRLAAGLPEVSTLAGKYGIPLTPGVLSGSQSGRWLEQKLAQLPVVGAGARQRIDEGVVGVNQAAFNDALSSIGGARAPEIGPAGVRNAFSQVGDAYDAALRGVRVPVTPELRKTVNDAIGAAGELDPKYSTLLKSQIGPLLRKRTLSGTDVQLVLSRSRAVSAAARKADGGAWSEYVLPHINTIENATTDAVNAVAPTAAQALQAANAAFRKTMIVADSVNDHLHEGGVFTPDTLLKHVERNISDFEGGPTLARGEKAGGAGLPLLDLATAAANRKTGMLVPGENGGVALPAALGALGLGLGEAGLESALSPADKRTGAHDTGFTETALRNAALLAGAGVGPRAAYSRPVQEFLQSALARRASPVATTAARLLPPGLTTALAPGREYQPPSLDIAPNMAIRQLPAPSATPPVSADLAVMQPDTAEAAPPEEDQNPPSPFAVGGRVRRRR